MSMRKMRRNLDLSATRRCHGASVLSEVEEHQATLTVLSNLNAQEKEELESLILLADSLPDGCQDKAEVEEMIDGLIASGFRRERLAQMRARQ